MNDRTTVARVAASGDAHWYGRNGTPHHFVERADGKGTRSTHKGDAKKHGWLPSVTSILKAADKPALTAWKIEQACLAIATSTPTDGEGIDAFIKCVLHEERQQDQEAKAAYELGGRIHNEIEQALIDAPWDTSLAQYVDPVLEQVRGMGAVLKTEQVVVNESIGYAGRFDALLESHDGLIVLDFKCTKSIPEKSPWPEHKMQLGAYAAALGNTGDQRITTANVYISTIEPGKVVVHRNDDWLDDYTLGFIPLAHYWQYANQYWPQKVGAS